ncbi:MAG: site-specific integrase [Cytophagaceae bacterium]|nr:site-specific integrase [Cytophagaceae bacterium]
MQRDPIKKSLNGYTTKNSNVRKIANEIDEVKDKLINQRINPTVDEVKRIYEKKYTPKEPEKDFFQLFEEFIKNAGKRSHSTIKSYHTVLNNLKTFEHLKGEKISLDKIDYNFYDRLHNYFLKEHVLNGKRSKKKDKKVGMTPTAAGNQIKTLKSFLRHLIRKGINIDADLSEFKAYKEKPTIIYLSQEELETLYSHDFSAIKKYERVRDLFVLQCSTGLRISDFKRLGIEHIHGSIIKMKSHKTMKDIIVPLTPKSDAILKKYNYELPMISEQKINEYIKEACKLAGINSLVEIQEYRNGNKIYNKYFKYQLIKTHVAVKTFISHCGERGISAKVVSEITGKTVKIILDHYYGTSNKVIEMEMHKAFGSPEANLKVV